MRETAFAPDETVGAAELARAGLLLLGEQAAIDATTVFVPADAEGAVRRIEIGSGARIGAYTVLCGGTCIGENAQVEEYTIVGKPERGYAVGHVYPGAGAHTQIGPGVIVRAGAVIYAGVQAGAATVIGHHTLLRSFVTVGEDTQLGHNLTIERAARIGGGVRCSYPASSSSCVVIAATSPGARTPPSYTTISPSGRSGREGTQSTTSTRPGGRSRPSSSATSRRHAACGDSSFSTAPPGRSHVGLYVGSTSRIRPSSSRNNAPAAIRFRARDAMY